MKKTFNYKPKEDAISLLEILLVPTIIMGLIFATMWAMEAKAETFDVQYNPPKGLVLEFNPDIAFESDLFVLDDAVNFLISYEGFREGCYEDAGGFSQGYGHQCIGGKITKARSRAIVKREVNRLYKHIPHDFSGDQVVGIISFLYNHPFNQDRYIEMLWSDKDSFLAELEYKANNYVYLNGIRYGGLKPRRQEELSLINNL